MTRSPPMGQPDDPGPDPAAPGAERAIGLMGRAFLWVALILIGAGATGVAIGLFFRVTSPG